MRHTFVAQDDIRLPPPGLSRAYPSVKLDLRARRVELAVAAYGRSTYVAIRINDEVGRSCQTFAVVVTFRQHVILRRREISLGNICFRLDPYESKVLPRQQLAYGVECPGGHRARHTADEDFHSATQLRIGRCKFTRHIPIIQARI